MTTQTTKSTGEIHSATESLRRHAVAAAAAAVFWIVVDCAVIATVLPICVTPAPVDAKSKAAAESSTNSKSKPVSASTKNSKLQATAASSTNPNSKPAAASSTNPNSKPAAASSTNSKSQPTILEVFPGQAAEAAGIKSGDKIISAGDQLVNRAEEFIRQVHLYKNTGCKIILRRGAETVTKTIKPNADGRIGVRVSDMIEAMVNTSERTGAITCKITPRLQEVVNPNGNVPVVACLKPGTKVKVLYEEPLLIKSTGKHMGMCRIRLDADTMGTNGDEFEKGDWYTFSRYLLPTRIPPGATTKSQIVNIEQSEALTAGMTLAAVRGLLGSSGNLVSRDRNVSGVVGKTIVWQNPDGTNLCCNFENDRLVYKSAFLLK